MLIKIGRDKKPKPQIFDVTRLPIIGHEDLKVDLPIDTRQENAVDALFVQFYQKTGHHLDPNRIRGWFVIGKNKDKLVHGHIVDIYPTRELLVKTVKNGNVPVPFEHVKILKHSRP